MITGLSGAGKSQAVATFEDMGYFCIDNLPPQMLPRVAELFSLEGSRVDQVAVVLDARGRRYFERARGGPGRVWTAWACTPASCSWRRPTTCPGGPLSSRPGVTHPLAPDDRLLDGIREERGLLSGLRERADVVIDTSGLNVHELRQRVQEALLAGEFRQTRCW